MLLIILSTLVVAASSRHTFRFSDTMGDNMVLQQAPLRAQVWGITDGVPGEEVTVRLLHSSNTTVVQEITTTAVQEGPVVWKVHFDPVATSSETYLVSATLNGITITMSNILFGDVFFCAGQSNMLLSVIQAVNASAEIVDSNYPDIRIMTTSLTQSNTEQSELHYIQQRWVSASQDSIGGPPWKVFSATCWFFGKRIYESKRYPIGLVVTAWGGTPIRVWSPPDAIQKCNLPPPGRWEPSSLWNAMVAPFTRMVVKAFIYYQGETDGMEHEFSLLYACSFPALISSWRNRWMKDSGISNTTEFGFIQISSWFDKNENTCQSDVGCIDVPNVRTGQLANYRYVPNPAMPNTFMTTAVDLGDPVSPWKDYHSRFKQISSYRLANAAENAVYGKNTYWKSPYPSDAIFNGTNIEITFTSLNSSIEIRNSAGFEYRLSTNPNDYGWVSVGSSVITISNDRISFVVSPPPVGVSITEVRYAWYQVPCLPHLGPENCAVYDKLSGLPAIPFKINVTELECPLIKGIDGSN